MAAGLGFKTFNTGDVLSAADVNGYLMQGVLVFADATARDAAITSPQEGQFAFTKNNDSLWYYSGSAWVASGATGDIEGVTAGVGISGGGTSGTVTITNSMATAIDAKGDLVVGTGADTFSRLAVGTNGHTLVADSAEATGLKWAAPASGGGITQIQSITANNQASVEFTSIPNTYKNIYIVVRNFKSATDGTGAYFRFNSDANANRHLRIMLNDSVFASYGFASSEITFTTSIDNSVADGGFYIEIPDYANTTGIKRGFWNSFPTNATTTANITYSAGNAYYNQTGAITSFEIKCDTGNITSGTFILYGVN